MQPCAPCYVSVILGTQGIQCIWLEESKDTFLVKATHKTNFCMPQPFAQPAIIETAIRSFLQQHKIKDAFLSIALQKDITQNEDAITPQQLLQCQLLAINTPFHCAGITTQSLAQTYALEHLSATHSCHALASDDLLCSMGLYYMARN